ncbi:hypothetical protein FNV43_RR17120 [Rhamnella rubrinervis]|uniref:Protein kinase domain-containing protein n=1 Tax=Rhamnella rubrinervis TaxID=2594499 RepID=A0A8K0DWY1_9ROSA|nr:hypothetical protein FNV43_RR17120 [Rhamnella rubrinervis]
MAKHFLSLYALFLLLVFFTTQISAQSPPPSTTATNFTCSAISPPSCETYVAYFARPPKFTSLDNISDLFEVSRLSIARASNLVSECIRLVPNQLLLVPITCGCTRNRYFANITYQIKKDDSYYSVSIEAFQRLTEWHVVEEMNPTLTPTLLQIGVEVVFPLFCGCPSKTHLENGTKLFITYVWQPTDDIVSVGAKFNASADKIKAENSYQNFSAAVGFPVLIPVSQFPALSQPPPPHESNKFKHRLILIAAISSIVALLIFLVAWFLVCNNGSQEKKKILYCNSCCSVETADLIIQKKKITKSELKIKQDKLLPGVSGHLGKPIMYDAKTIMEATMNLNENFRIGGSVYRAMIDGQVLAVKKAKENVTEELKILQKVNHANLVNLMGISFDSGGNRFLVYEYAENGSLDKWLHSKSSASSSSATILTWNQRLNIALDVANGLQYMHEHIQPSIVHREIRTQSVLLDSRFKAKIGNFSMARQTSDDLMQKVDVFTFGVVLLELLSGKKAMETMDNGEVVVLWKEAKAVFEGEERKEERLREWMDSKLESFYPVDGALSLTTLAWACTQEKPSARPSMAEIVFNLSVLTQLTCETPEGSWNSNVEAEEVIHVINPIIAR